MSYDLDERTGQLTQHPPAGRARALFFPTFNGTTSDGEPPKVHMDEKAYEELAKTQMGGVKYDADKARMDLLPFEVLEEVAKVLGFGAVKYHAWNWFSGFDYSRLQASTLRHISAFQQGQDNDPESGINHLSHAICGLMFLRALQIHGKGKDDRCKRKE
jgi:hypothetical protein